MNLMEETIRSFLIVARKSRNKFKVTVLSTLIGEIETKTKRTGVSVPDGDIISMIRKTMQNNIDIHEKTSDDNLLRENALLEELLPQQMSAREIDLQISLGGDFDNIGQIMQYFNVHFQSGTYDRKLLSERAKIALSGN